MVIVVDWNVLVVVNGGGMVVVVNWGWYGGRSGLGV